MGGHVLPLRLAAIGFCGQSLLPPSLLTWLWVVPACRRWQRRWQLHMFTCHFLLHLWAVLSRRRHTPTTAAACRQSPCPSQPPGACIYQLYFLQPLKFIGYIKFWIRDSIKMLYCKFVICIIHAMFWFDSYCPKRIGLYMWHYKTLPVRIVR